MPEYIAPFLISLLDEVYNRSAGIISITAIVAIWSAAKGVQYMTDGLNSVNDLGKQEIGLYCGCGQLCIR